MFHTGWPRLLRVFSILCVFAFVSLTLATDQSQVNPQLTPSPAQRLELHLRQRLLEEAYTVLYEGESLEAVDAFTAVIEVAPDWAEGYTGRGLAHIFADELSQALEDFDRAVALGSDDAHINFWRSFAFLFLLQYDDALEAISRAIALNPRIASNYRVRANIYLYQRRFDDAIADYEHSLVIDPNSVFAYQGRDEAYTSLGSPQEAAIAAYLASGLTALDEGNVLSAQRDFTQAIDAATTLNLSRTLSYAYLYRSETYQRQQDVDDANADLEAALIANPTLGDAYVKLGDYDSAVRVEPDNPLMYWLRAEFKMAQNQFESAAPDVLAFINLNNQHRVDVASLPSEGMLLGYEIKAGWSYWFSFDAQPGQQVSFSARPKTLTEIAPILLILDGNGHPVVMRQNDLSNVVLQDGGQYTLVLAPGGVNFDSAMFTLSATFADMLTAPQHTGTASRWTATPTNTPTSTPTTTPTATLTPTATPTIDMAMGRFVRLRTLSDIFVDSITWSHDGANLLTYSAVTGLSSYAITDLNARRALAAYDEYSSFGLSVSPDGRLLAYGSSDIILRDPTTGRLINRIREHARFLNAVVFSPDGRFMFTGDSQQNYILWDATSQTKLDTLDNTSFYVSDATFSPAGDKLALIDNIGRIFLYEIVDNTRLEFLNNGRQLGSLVYLTSTSGANWLAFSPDGTLLASEDANNTVVLWDVARNRVVRTLRGHRDAVTNMAFSPDSLILATGSNDRTVKLWHVPTGQEIASLEIGGAVATLDFNPSRMILAVKTGGLQTQIWGLSDALEASTATPSPTLAPIELTATVAALTATSTPTATLSGSGYLERGDAAFATRNYLAALADYDLAVAIDDENIASHVSRGHALGELNRWHDAIAAYTHALELDEDNPDFYAYIARAYESIQGEENAELGIDYANRALAIDPDNVVALTHRARGYYRLSDYDSAMADLNRALELDPGYSEAYIIRGVVYGRGLQLRDLAFADFETALEIAPYDERTYRYRGLVYFDFDNSDDALTNLSRSIELDPNYVEAHTDRGRVYLYLTENFEDAEADFLRALELSPDDIFALTNLGLTYIRQNQYGLAVDVLERAVLVDPVNASALISLGEAYYFLDQPQKALDAYWRGFAVLPPDAAPVPSFVLNHVRELEIRLNVTATPTSTPQESIGD